MTTQQQRYEGCLVGLAAGDAIGTTVEFEPRGSFEPVTDMEGCGPFRLRPGEWTDDTSMALCLAASLLEKRGFDPYDQMERYCRWREEGYMSSNGRCFDIGNTVARALYRFRRDNVAYAGSTDPRSAGNGCIMRLAPVVLYYHPDPVALDRYTADSSRTTHGAAECLDACRLLGRILSRALSGQDQETVLLADREGFQGEPAIMALTRGEYRDKKEDGIRGSGYVVAALEAALWCFWHSQSFEEAILKAANLGEDADTTAAICGQVAGAFYGIEGIPASWRAKLARGDEIMDLAGRLYRERPASQSPGSS